jgi:hypothetical protein
MEYYTGSKSHIFRKDRLSTNIEKEVNDIISKYGLDLKFEDVLIETDEYNDYEY